jgi:AraC family transcriptional regulator, arabinose operon regulatory protein
MKSNIPKKYWSGEGRKIVAIPQQVLKKQSLNNALLNNLYITDLGYYPHASKHHTHRKNGCPENILIYCSDGVGWVRTSKGRYEVKANSFFMLPKNNEHEYGASEQDPWTIYWIRFGGSGLNSLNDLTIAKHYFEPKHFPYKTDAIQLFNDMFSVLQQGYSKQYLIYVNMTLVNFLTLFLFQHGSIIKKVTTNPHDIIIQKAIGYMQTNLHNPITNSDLSIAAGCSGSQLSNLFKSSTGYSPINYFNHLKIQKACQHFYATNALVKEVATQLGYDDPYYFSRLFTKLMGVSPNQYRKRNIQK